MKKVPLGNTGEQVSELCLGTMMFGARCAPDEAARVLDAALDHGVDFLDTAAMYNGGKTEEILGTLLRGRRDRFFIATKVHCGLDAASITRSLDESLQRLGTDRVDLYMIHWPAEGMQPAEIMEALNRTVVAGKTRYIGCCNFPAWLLAHCNAIASEHGWAKLVSHQVAYNLIERGAEVEILPQAVAEGIALTVYRPVVQGLLTGKYRWGNPLPGESRGETSSQIITWLSQYGGALERFLRHAQERGVEPAHLAVAWLRSSPAVTCPIIGVSSARQLLDSLGGFQIELAEQERVDLQDIFDAEVKEEGLQLFPGLRYNFPRLRRNLHLLG